MTYKFLPFKIHFERKPKVQTILQMAEETILLLNELSKFSTVFSTYRFVNKKNCAPAVEVNNPQAVDVLAQQILSHHQGGIRQYEKVNNPDIHYSRESPDLGFSLTFGQGTDEFAWGFSTGGAKEWQVRAAKVSKTFLPDLTWYMALVKIVVTVLKLDQATIRFNYADLLVKMRASAQPCIGLINYFSASSGFIVPPDLPHVTRESMPEGTLFYLPSENINADGEPYNLLIKQLFEVAAALGAAQTGEVLAELERIAPLWKRE